MARITSFRASLPGILLLALPALSPGCSVFELGEYQSFGAWFIGPPGFTRALNGTDNEEGIRGDRPWIYAHLRIPEVIFQPAGWLSYPRRRTITNESLFDAWLAGLEAQSEARQTGYGEAHYTRHTVLESGHENALAFDFFDAGFIEIIPYRVWASEAGVGYKIGMTVLQPLTTTMTALMCIVRLPVLAVHDTLKTVMIPGAGIYYALQDEPSPPPPSEPSAGAPSG